MSQDLTKSEKLSLITIFSGLLFFTLTTLNFAIEWYHLGIAIMSGVCAFVFVMSLMYWLRETGVMKNEVNK